MFLPCRRLSQPVRGRLESIEKSPQGGSGHRGGILEAQLSNQVPPDAGRIAFSSFCHRRRQLAGGSLQRIFGPSANVVFTPQARNAAPAVASLQARAYAADAKASPTEVSSILEQRIRGVQEESNLAETGRVLSVGYVFAWPQLG